MDRGWEKLFEKPAKLAFPDAIYLVDAIQGGEMLMKACKPALESMYVTKVIHDCKRDSEIAYHPIDEQEGRKRLPDDYISFVSLLADPGCGGISYLEEEEVRILLMQDDGETECTILVVSGSWQCFLLSIAEILIGGAKGPPDKVFIIGPVKQVGKAEAILRGRMMDL
ncbi:hypothetical protein NL676_005294 [Syzygium grande]|nr:hypothetical protein NL676_005294 [Syzygium grande]